MISTVTGHPLHQMGLARGAQQRCGRSYLLGLKRFLAALTSHVFLVAILRFYHDRQLRTTKGPGQESLRTKYGHRCPQSRGGGLE